MVLGLPDPSYPSMVANDEKIEFVADATHMMDGQKSDANIPMGKN